MTSTSLGETDVIVLYGSPGQPYQLAFPDPNCKVDQVYGTSKVSTSSSDGRTVVQYDIISGETTILTVTGGVRDVTVIILDTEVAYFTWEAVIPASGTLGSHYSIGSNETVLAIGP